MNGNTHSLHALPEIYTHEEQMTVASEMNEIEQNKKTSAGFSPDMIEEENQSEPGTPPCPNLCPNANDGQINPRQLGQRVHDGKYLRVPISVRIVSHRRTLNL